jgi:hypothetical protein
MWIFAIGIEDPLMMPVDRLQHPHLGRRSSAVVLWRPRDETDRVLHFVHPVL